MPIKPLPVELVKRLRALVKKEVEKKRSLDRAYRLLGRMKIVDHRAGERKQLDLTLTDTWARRVRQMSVSRNYPKTRLVIKRVHDLTARKTLELLRKQVRAHNRRFKSEGYELRMPLAYPIGKDLVAMAKTSAPSLEEVLIKRSRRGERLFKELKEKHGFSGQKLKRIVKTLLRDSEIEPHNMIVFVENKKLVFVPLVDIKDRKKVRIERKRK